MTMRAVRFFGVQLPAITNDIFSAVHLMRHNAEMVFVATCAHAALVVDLHACLDRAIHFLPNVTVNPDCFVIKANTTIAFY